MKYPALLLLGLVLVAGAAVRLTPPASTAAEAAKPSAPPAAPGSGKTESVVLGGGCFWCLDAGYKLLPGVIHVTSGYAGGTVAKPTYEQVCTGQTGHAEVVKIDYDPARTSLAKILEYFWKVHDATQAGGQGNDLGPQYRSIILFADPAQQAAAESSRHEAQTHADKRITTEIVALKDFWPAEDYHQDYFAKNPDQAYCSAVIQPKVDKLRQLLKSWKSDEAKP